MVFLPDVLPDVEKHFFPVRKSVAVVEALPQRGEVGGGDDIGSVFNHLNRTCVPVFAQGLFGGPVGDPHLVGGVVKPRDPVHVYLHKERNRVGNNAFEIVTVFGVERGHHGQVLTLSDL